MQCCIILSLHKKRQALQEIKELLNPTDLNFTISYDPVVQQIPT